MILIKITGADEIDVDSLCFRLYEMLEEDGYDVTVSGEDFSEKAETEET